MTRGIVCVLAFGSLLATGVSGVAVRPEWTAKVYFKVEPGRAGREKIRLYTADANGVYQGHDGQGVQVCDNIDWERSCEWFVPVANSRHNVSHMTIRLNKSTGRLQDKGVATQIMATQGRRTLRLAHKPVEGTDGKEIEAIITPK